MEKNQRFSSVIDLVNQQGRMLVLAGSSVVRNRWRAERGGDKASGHGMSSH
jgi:hypothetical protein